MPPRYAYWTILVDDQPTAFRAGAQEDLMPTFKRLQSKHPSAKMMWFQNGKLWDSRVDAQEAMRARGDIGRARDPRQVGFRSRDRASFKPQAPSPKPRWEPKGERKEWTPPSTRERFRESKPSARSGQGKLDWKPKGEFIPAPKRADRSAFAKATGAFVRSEKPAWRPKGSAPDRRPDWKPRGDEGGPSTREPFRDSKPFARSGQGKPAWKPKGAPSTRKPFRDSKPFARSGQGKPAWRPKTQAPRPRPSGSKLEWTPKSSSPQAPKPSGSGEKRKWVPKTEYKKSLGIEAKKDKNWRPGGEHKDPRQKYKDAKKAKWTKFKKAIRTRSDKKKS